MTGFYLEVTNFLFSLDGRVVFAVGLTVCMVAFLLNFIIMLSARNYLFKKRVWLFVLYTAVLCLQLACDNAVGWKNMLSLHMFSILLLLSIPSLVIPARRKSVTQEQLDFVRFMDSKIRGTQTISLKETQTATETPVPDHTVGMESRVKEAVRVSVSQNGNREDRSSQGVERKPLPEAETPDFSHVKNIIARLDGFGLSVADRKQVNDLQTYIARAENGEIIPDVKRRINDGLGALLKIMSKYGV